MFCDGIIGHFTASYRDSVSSGRFRDKKIRNKKEIIPQPPAEVQENKLVDCEGDESEDEIDPTDTSYIDGMEGHEFEYFCAALLCKNGFYDVSVTRGCGDQGVDILAVKGDVRYAIHCKNYVSPLSNKPVQ